MAVMAENVARLVSLYRKEVEALRQKCEAHDVIEGETVDALRALFQHAATSTIAPQLISMMETWHCRHQPVEWEIIVGFAELPKALADHIREEGFE